jgi:hypothetical protein
MTPLERVLAVVPPLAGGKHYRPRNGVVNVRCPVHGDPHPSLGLRELPNGKLLIHCYAGCDTRAVLDALNLEWRDLRP